MIRKLQNHLLFSLLALSVVMQAQPASVLALDKDESKQADSQKQKGYSEAAVKHYNKGVELHHGGFLNQAIQEYKAAIEADANIAEAFSNLGAVYLAQRNYPKAQDAFTRALALKPNRPTTLNGLGNALYARGQTEEAKAKWKEAIAADPKFASAYYNMGNALESEKDSRGAIGEYMKAIEANPKMADAYYRVGSILSKDKHPAQASVFLTQAVTLSPEADFVKEARRIIATNEADFARDSQAKDEMEMNLHLPRKDSQATRDSGSKEKKAVPEETKKVVSEPDKKTSESGDDKSKRRWPFVRKKREEKKVEMFVQPPEPGQDLKPSPKSDGAKGDTWQ